MKGQEPLTSILFEQPEESEPVIKKPRIDLKFEKVLLRCAIGCLVNDIYMSGADYMRMHLAIARLSNNGKG